MNKKYTSQVLTVRKQFNLYLPLKPNEQEQINKMFEQEQVYSSNHIEGNSYSLDETQFLLETGIPAKGKKLKDSIEIKNLKTSIDYAHSYKGKLTERFIKDLHKRVTAGLFENPDISGNYKTERNWVGNLETSSPQATPVHMKQLIAWYTSKLESISKLSIKQQQEEILILASEFKFRFICIHPFTDGNGRVSRLLFNFIVRTNGFIDVSILPEDKQDYYSALKKCKFDKKSNTSNSDSLTEFMCKCLVKQYQRIIAKLE